MAKQYRVTLTAEERREWEGWGSKGKSEAQKRAHARILLQAQVIHYPSEGQNGKTMLSMS